MDHSPTGDFLTQGRIVQALLRRWFSIVLLTFLLVLATAAALFSLPDLYESQSLLYVRLGRGTVSLDPTSTAASSTISLMDSRQSEINSVESQLRDEKNRNELMTIAGKQELILQETKQLQSDRLKASGEVAALQARDHELQAKIVTLPEKLNLEQTAGLGNAATDSMRNQLFELEKIEIELKSKYTDNHPLVAQVRQRLSEAKKIYSAQADDRTTNRQALNPIRQDLELDMFRNLSTLEGWKAQLAEINVKLGDVQVKAAKPKPAAPVEELDQAVVEHDPLVEELVEETASSALVGTSRIR